jgi:hypothetical protein
MGGYTLCYMLQAISHEVAGLIQVIKEGALGMPDVSLLNT